MYLIDKTYFQGKINVPNSDEFNGEFDSSLEMAIDKYAPLFLQNVLGAVLFNELNPFIVGVNLDPLAPQKWKDLIDGVVYDDGKKVWKGLRYSTGLHKESVLAYFVYLNYYQETNSSGVGQVVDIAKNGLDANTTKHLTEVYNIFVELYQSDRYCYGAERSYINGALFIDYYNNRKNSGFVSLLEFLQDNKDIYIGYTANQIAYKNQLGI